MKQKVIIKLEMDCDKCRNKALKIAAEVPGVTAVSLEGDEKDHVAVTGDDVDMVCLANQLKKKFRSVIILSVEDLKKVAEEKKKREEEEKKRKEEEKERKRIEEERKKNWLMAALGCEPCSKCHSSSCHGKCESETCSKCHNSNCDGMCVLICVNCEKPKCKGQCKKSCSNCGNPKCGGCKPCTPAPTSPASFYMTCPPYCTCSRCYLPYQPCKPYPYCQVVYDPNPDSCSIM